MVKYWKRLNPSFRITAQSIAATIIAGFMSAITFDSLEKVGIDRYTSSILSTFLVAFMAVPTLRLAFETDTPIKNLFMKYLLLCVPMAFIMDSAYPFLEHLIKVDYYNFKPLIPYLAVKALGFPLYYLAMRFFVFK